ncbi:DoxX family protein [Gammaproteobacteria bacterium]|nr:DoxX family protein [Gammaproteobacteria bacterium]MDC3306347.1 DoxX family protein [Gammaproteobacteria bacterium]
MKKINSTLDKITNPLLNIVPWLPRLALGIAFFFHGYGKLPAPFMMDEQHRMVTWFESIFIPMPELWVNLVILGEMAAGIGIILGGVVGLFASQPGHLLTRLSGLLVVIIMTCALYIAHSDWFTSISTKFVTSEQMFLLVLGIFFAIRGNK